MTTKKTGLELLREPFPVHQISKLPKPTKQQTDDVKANFWIGIRCNLCGAWHHKDVIHLDYVGHAALTDRLLDCDPLWNWEPLALKDGLPAFDNIGGLWIKLNLCGHTVIGYGHAGDKKGGDAIKEIIGDALRNAAMRLGAALDLWHKGDLHADDGNEASQHKTSSNSQAKQPLKSEVKEQPRLKNSDFSHDDEIKYSNELEQAKTMQELGKAWASIPSELKPFFESYKNTLKAKFLPPKTEAA